MDIDGLRAQLKRLERDPTVGSKPMSTLGRNQGAIGLPIASHKGVDVHEFRVEHSYKRVYDDALRQYQGEIGAQRSNIDRRLLKTEDDMQADRPEEEIVIVKAQNSYSDVVDSALTGLYTLGERAKESQDNLNRFKNINDLARAPEFSHDRMKNVIGILGCGLFVGVVMFVLFKLQLEGVIAVPIVVVVNSVFAIAAGEAWRARIHKQHSMHVFSIVVLVAIVLIVVAVNLGNGHYQDALNEEFPSFELGAESTTTVGATSADTTEVGVVSRDECARISENADGYEDHPSAEALCLLMSKPIVFNEWQSAMCALLGFVLFLGVGWLWWRNDDEYFGYGFRARRCGRRMGAWYDQRNEVIRILGTVRDQAVERVEEVAVDLVGNWKSARENGETVWAATNDLVREIVELCRATITVYRASNRQARPRFVKSPSQWDEPWAPSWGAIPEEPLGDLCTQQEAIELAKQEHNRTGMAIATIESGYREAVRRVNNLGPKINEGQKVR
ncbi:MAG: hypothetical protein OXM02_05835 [Bacteroidota bacterium]|nr:hypothetical protein [Bacteroidota bacterium]